MTDKKEKIDLKKIDEKTREELYEYYYRQFGYVLPNLTKAFSEVIEENDALALCFLIDIFNGLAQHALKTIKVESDEVDEQTWLSPKPGKC